MAQNQYPIEGPEVAKPMPPHARRIFQGRIFGLWQWDQACYDGSSAVFERITRADYSSVVAVLKDGRIMLVEDEQPDRNAVLTAAGGGLEPAEDAAAAAARELQEETGYRGEEIVHWYSYRPANKVESVTYAFIARGAVKALEPCLEAGEKIQPVYYTFEEFVALGRNPRLRDWLMRIKLLEAELDPAKRVALKSLLYGK